MNQNRQVLRAGSWSSARVDCRSAKRRWNFFEKTKNYDGCSFNPKSPTPYYTSREPKKKQVEIYRPRKDKQVLNNPDNVFG